jgi:hypothetical protein
VVGNDTEVVPLQSRVTLELKNIDPLSTREELVQDIYSEWKLDNQAGIVVEALRMAPWGTQQTVLMAPATILPAKTAALKIRTSLTLATGRII